MKQYYNKELKAKLSEEGPWIFEPDKANWVYAGLDCMIVRNSFGALCGYVGVPKSHRLYGAHYDDADGILEYPVHGGLTFADECHETEDESTGICHPEEGCANKEVWWYGFDCAHAGDFIPSRTYPSFNQDIYRDFEYVKKEVELLAEKLNECNAVGSISSE